MSIWVYFSTAPSEWTVGFFLPDGQWIPESDHASADAAAQRVHYLNGGHAEKQGAKYSGTA